MADQHKAGPKWRLTAPSQVRAVLDAHGVHIKKRYGQNFLIDHNILTKIVDAADVKPSDTVIEIGPGVGALTQALAEKAGQVVAIEIDNDLIPVLGDVFSDHTNVKIVHGDALAIDLEALLGAEHSIKVVANLPYYITSPLIMRFLESSLPLDRMVVMVQAEVADRLAAQPGTKAYGALSVAVQYRALVERVTKAPRTVFLPQPNVDSMVVKLTMRPYAQQAADEGLLRDVVRAAFGQRRKTMRRSLEALAGELGLDVEEVLREARVDPGARGEDLAVDCFVSITNIVTSMVQ